MKTRPILPHEIAVGKPLPWSIYDCGEKLLLKQGQVIRSEDLLRAILQRGFVKELESVRVREAITPTRDTDQDPDQRSVFRRVRHFHDAVEAMLLEFQSEPSTDVVDRCLGLARRLRTACEEDIDAALAAYQVDVREAIGSPAARAIQNAVLCDMMGRALELQGDSRDELICAAFTHDLGMYGLCDEFNRQKLALNREQRELLETHTARGRELLEQAGVASAMWLTAVEQHHERLDGSGYPHRLTGEAISLSARILAVADIFTAMIRPRAYREAVQSRDAMRQIFLERGRCVDESMTAAFIRDMGLYPPGTLVRLKNGEVAVVVRRGASAALPQLRAVVAADGAPLGRYPVRDSADPTCSITCVLPSERYRSVLGQVHQLWDPQPPSATVAA